MRLLIPDLLPGVSYAIQVRADGGALQSEWSNRFEITTTLDTTPPDVPDWAPSNEWVVNGDTFVATWQALNLTLPQNLDFDHYELELSDTVVTRVIRTTNTFYTLDFESNRIFFGTPKATVTARVRSADKIGNVSAWSTIKSVSNPAPAAPASIGVTALYDSVKVEWAAVSDADLAGYKLQVSTTSSSTGFSDVYNGSNTTYVHNTTAFLSDHWYRVYAVDKFGTQSTATTSSAVKPKSALAVDSTPPTAPTAIAATQGFDATKQEAWVNIAWTASVSSDVGNYEVRYSTTAGTNWQYITAGKDVTAVRIEGLLPNTSYYVDVRAVDYSGNASAWVNDVTTGPVKYPIATSADTTAPSQPSAPTASVGTMKLQVVVDGLKQAGGAMEADTAYYEVFASTTNGFTTYNSTTMLGTIQKGPAMIETFQIPASGSGTTQTWYVKTRAVDRSGNVSAASNQTTAAVGLILTANIGDLQVTDAKINTLTASKITAGTISAQTITIGTGGAFIVDSTGIIRSNNYVSGSTGYKLDSTGLEINNGTIYAAGLKIRDGRNIMAADYDSFERNDTTSPYVFGKTGGAANTGAEQTPTIVIGPSKFGYQHLRNQWTATTTNQPVLYLSPSPTTYNITVEANNQYILSGYFWNQDTQNSYVYLRIAWATAAGTFISFSTAANQSINATNHAGVDAAVRLSGVVTAPANATKAVVYIESATMTNGAGYSVDGIQLESVAGGITTPSTWKETGSTTIDGGLIRTSELRSVENLTINDVTLPYWSISTMGSALFSDLTVRGTAVVGGATQEDIDGTTTGAGSRIQSYNYTTTGDSGWAIHSNGLAEFRSIVAGSLRGEAIAPGTVSAEVFTSRSLLTSEIIVDGSIHTIGDMGEDIGIDGEGFHVLGPYQVAVTNKVLTSNVATLTTSIDHGFSVGNKLVVVNTGDPFDGTWVIASVPSSNTFTYVNSAADFATAPVFGGIAKSLSSSTAIERPKLIDFPTDGSNPNIISGTLSADTLTVSLGASLRGSSTIDNGTLVIAAGVLAPKSAPVVTQTYKTLSLTGSEYSASYGVTKGHNGNYFILNRNASGDNSQFYIKEFDSTTGAYVGTVFTQNVHTTAGNNIIGEDHVYTRRGLVYSPTHNKYYLALTDIWYRYGGRPVVPYVPPTPDRDEVIWTLDTSFAVTNKFVVTSDPDNDLGWNGCALGLDHTNNDKLVHGIYSPSGTPGLRIADVNLTAGVPTSAGGYFVITSTVGLTDPRVIMRVADIDGVSATRVIVKDSRPSGGASNNVNYWTPCNGLTPQPAEAWPAANNLFTSGGFYDDTENVVYALNSNGIVKYESGDSYWLSTTMTSQRWVGHSWYDSQASSTLNISNKAATTTVATLTTSAPHGYNAIDDIGKWVEVRGVDSKFNGHYQIASVPTTTTFTYNLSGSAVAATAASGTVKRGTYETPLSPVASVALKKRAAINVTTGNIPYSTGEFPDTARVYMAFGPTMPTLTGTVSASWKLRETINYPDTSVIVSPTPSASGDRPNNTTTNTFAQINSPSMIQSSTGNSFWKGDDTAQFYQLVLNSNSNATTGAGNKPALRIGPVDATHLRIDGNSVFAMTSNTVQGSLFLNGGGQTNVAALVASADSEFNAVLRNPGMPTSSGTANCTINPSTLSFRINTSSRRYKENITDAVIDPDVVLNLKPRTYQRNDDLDDNDEHVPLTEDSPWHVGFIAEEAADLGLEPWVVRKSDGQIISFAYDYFVVAHQAVLQQQKAQIKELQDKVAALETSA